MDLGYTLLTHFTFLKELFVGSPRGRATVRLSVLDSVNGLYQGVARLGALRYKLQAGQHKCANLASNLGHRQSNGDVRLARATTVERKKRENWLY